LQLFIKALRAHKIVIQKGKFVQKISDYSGQLLNHFEAVYRPGDRGLAREFLTALGLYVEDYSVPDPDADTMLGIHFEASDRDPTNNIIFLHRMSESQAKLDTILQSRLASDAELADAHANFLETVSAYPGATPHFGIRYRSIAALDAVLTRLDSASPGLKKRVTATEMAPYPTRPGMPDIRQVFVRTDVFTTSPAGFGQTIELQVERPAAG
jgi:hypothetical protein